MAVFNALSVVFLVVVGLVAAVGCYLICSLFWFFGERRRVVRVGRRVPARCVDSYDPDPLPPPRPEKYCPRKRRFVLEYPGADGGTVRFEATSPPATTCVGDQVAVAFLPDRPGSAVVVAEADKSALVQSLQVLAILCVFLVVMAGIAFVGVEILQAYGEIVDDPNTWIEP
ncbi:DUF3592 domain-containing protein [Streptomyces triticiradicis]|uniref:DUF3592 domain-containing protein n=1 Tax=Streptomyces triticiradicis TaxID=2651189 RepID=A0A7J5D1B4_9ACTN|nr:DUF3592 domain-containing protein [Streptomyces triticiradicis]KAB1976637.1 hypothetical protein F8144_43785 [Streptomyces triticiradicis]